MSKNSGDVVREMCKSRKELNFAVAPVEFTEMSVLAFSYWSWGLCAYAALVFALSVTFRAANSTPAVPLEHKFPRTFLQWKRVIIVRCPFSKALNPKLPLWVRSEAIASVKGSGGSDDLPGMIVRYCVNVKLQEKSQRAQLTQLLRGQRMELVCSLKQDKWVRLIWIKFFLWFVLNYPLCVSSWKSREIVGSDGGGRRRGASARERQSGSADQSLKENMRCFSVSAHTDMSVFIFMYLHFCLRARKWVYVIILLLIPEHILVLSTFNGL